MCLVLVHVYSIQHATGQWFSLGTPVSSTNKTYPHNITEILLKVALSTISHNRLWELVIIHDGSHGDLPYAMHVVSSTPHHERDSNSQRIVVIGTDCTGSCKCNYHMIMTMMLLSPPIKKTVKETDSQVLMWFSLGTPVSSTNKTYPHNITEIC
jgi:hypothetical protein